MNDNPYYRPLQKFSSDLLAVPWIFPYLPAIVSSFVMLLILLILGILCLTVGIASQLSTAFLRLIEDARLQMKSASSVEKSSYGIAIGVYCLFFVPLWLVQFPFQLLGLLFARMGPYALLPIVVLIGLAVFVDWSMVANYIRSLALGNDPTTNAASTVPINSESPGPNTNEESRIWTSEDGKYVTTAHFLGVAYGRVELLKLDGTKITVELKQLSEDDQLWVQNQISQK